MSWFKRNDSKPVIPPVEPENPPARSRYTSNSNTYVPSRDGELYRSSGQKSYDNYTDDADTQSFRDRYNRNNGVGDPYSRGNARLEDDRDELFSGYDRNKPSANRFYDGPPAGREPAPGEENEEDIEGIKRQIRYVKQESATSTRNALMLARQAEDTARATLDRLGTQSEKLADTERHLDVSKGHSTRASDMTDELKQLNRSIFRPVIHFNKDAKRVAQAAKVQARYEEERNERERTMMDVRETQNRLGRAAGFGRGDDYDEEGIGAMPGGSRRLKTEEQLRTRKAQRSRYQFESTGSDDELEDEIDDNLDEISEVTKRLNTLGKAMGAELDAQNKRLDVIAGKTDGLDLKLAAVTNRQKKF